MSVNIGTLFGNVVLRTKDLEKGIRQANRSLARFGKSTDNVGKQLSMGIGAPLAGIGVVATKTFATFGQEMAKVKAISGATAQEFSDLEANAKELGASTRFTANQVAGLQLNFSKIGLKPDEILAVTGATLDLALATGEDLAESAGVAARTMNAFRLEAEDMPRIVDVMAQSFSKSDLNLENFSAAMANAGTAAATVGLSLEDTTSMIATLVDGFIPAAKAGTDVRVILQALNEEGLSLNEAFSIVEQSTDKLGTATELVGRRAAAALILLSGSRPKLLDLSMAFLDAGGKAKVMASIMDDTLVGDLFKVVSAAEGVAIAMSEHLEPSLRKIAQEAGAFLQQNQAMLASLLSAAAKFGVVAMAVGFLMRGMGQLAFSIVNINNLFLIMNASARKNVLALKKLKTAIAAANVPLKVMTVLKSILFAKVTLIIAAITAVVLLFKQFPILGQGVGKAFKFIGQVGIASFLIIQDFVLLVTRTIKKEFSGSFKIIFDKSKEVFSKIGDMISTFVTNAQTFILKMRDKVVDIFISIASPVAELFGKIKNFIIDKLSGVLNWFVESIKKLADKFPLLFEKMGQSVENLTADFRAARDKTVSYFSDIKKESGITADKIEGGMSGILDEFNFSALFGKDTLATMELNPDLQDQIDKTTKSLLDLGKSAPDPANSIFSKEGQATLEETDDKVVTIADAFKSFGQDAETNGELALRAMENASDGMTDAFMKFFESGKFGLKDLASEFLSQTSKMILQAKVINPMIGKMGALFGISGDPSDPSNTGEKAKQEATSMFDGFFSKFSQSTSAFGSKIKDSLMSGGSSLGSMLSNAFSSGVGLLSSGLSSAFSMGSNLLGSVVGGLGSALGGLLGGAGKGIGGILGGIGSMFGPVGGAVGGILGGLFKADGGPVTAGRSYIVGERGPELFSPKSSGLIHPSEALAGGGGATINFKVEAVDAQSFNQAMHKNKNMLVSLVDQAMHKQAREGING